MENKTNKEMFMLEHDNNMKLFGKISKIVVAVRLPTNAVEIIINTDELESKYSYYLNAYDDDMRLKTNSEVCIVGCIFI